MQGTQLLERLESQMAADLVRVGLSGVFRQQSVVRPIGSGAKCLDVCDQLKSTGGWQSVRRIARLVDAHPETIRSWILCEGLPAHKLRGRWKIHGPSAAKWLESKLRTQDSAMCTTSSTDNKTISKDLPIGGPTRSQEVNIE